VIFVITGMEVHPFDRLARAVDELARTGVVEEDFFIQLGTCNYEPQHVGFERFLSFGEVREQIEDASVVVTHAGAGSALLCIERGKHPVVVPRRPSFGEQVDEHQLPFAEKLRAVGLATVVNEMEELAAAISSTRSLSTPPDALGRARELTDWLETFWDGVTSVERSWRGRKRGQARINADEP
jgi:UDP-N-acetylglucosamine transferase subunit ALG13